MDDLRQRVFDLWDDAQDHPNRDTNRQEARIRAGASRPSRIAPPRRPNEYVVGSLMGFVLIAVN